VVELIGCLFALFAGSSPRLALFIVSGREAGQGRRRLRHLAAAPVRHHLPLATLIYALLETPVAG